MSVKIHESFCLDSMQSQLFVFDDFLGDQIQDEWNSSGAAGGSGAVVDAQTGGIVRLTTDGDDGDDWYINWGNVRGLLVSKRVAFEARVKLPSVADIDFYIGLYNAWNDMIVFRMNSVVTPNYRCQLKDGGAQTITNSDLAVDTAFNVLRIEAHTHGANHIHFYVNGTELNISPIATNITALSLQPHLWVLAKAGGAKILDIDYVGVRQEI